MMFDNDSDDSIELTEIHHRKSNDSNKDAINHPYIQYITQLNMTESHKKLLLTGSKQIEQYVPDQAHYARLKKSFVEDYPQLAKSFQKSRQSDCTFI